MSTVISHFYNEEYLLPFWLEHHTKIFRSGVLIDYHSTDRSVEIINNIAPDWKVIKSRNINFEAHNVDLEVVDIEKNIEGWKICLNTTEFLLPNKKIEDILDSEYNAYRIPQYLVCDYYKQEISNTKSFIDNLNFGSLEHGYGYRFFHQMKDSYRYEVGRHQLYSEKIMEKYSFDMFIAHCRFYPWNEKQIERKLAIQKMIPESDRLMGRGWQHQVDRKKLLDMEFEKSHFCYFINREHFNKCYNYSIGLHNEY